MNSTLNAAHLAVLADDIETRAWVDFYDAAPPSVRSALGVSHETVADATMFMAPGTSVTLFNRAIGLGNRVNATSESAKRIAAYYAHAGVRDWWLHIGSHAKPFDLQRVLEIKGWHGSESTRWAKMLRRSTHAEGSVSTLRVAQTTNRDASDVVDAINEGFGLPAPFSAWLRALHGRSRWRLFGVFDGERAVGGGALFADGNNAWLGIGSIIASHRHRGGQRAVMARRVNEATRAGVDWIATETAEPQAGINPSLTNMQRCGFGLVAVRRNLLAPVSLIAPAERH